MSNIRVTYSGLIAFVIGITSVITGLVFILIITRSLTPAEFGTWSLIGTMIGYFLISERIISFWTTRQVARNEEVGKTSILSSTTFSAGAIPLYVAAVFLLSQQNNTDFEIMVFGLILIPVFFVSETLHSINLGHKPQATSYGLLGFELLKIPTALAFVYFLDLGVIGAIFTLTIAYLLRIAIQLYFARKKIGGKSSFRVLRRWLKLGWIPSYSNLARFLKSSDVVVYTVITGSVLGLAYYAVGYTLAKIIHHSENISKALYPKLIATGDYYHIQENFSLQMYFAIPLLGIVVIFAKPAMFALNPLYIDVGLIAIFLSFKMFFADVNGFFGKILQGIDTVDIEQNPKFSKLLNSKIFLVFTIKNIHSGLQLGLVIIVLLILTFYGFTELELVTWWAFVSLSLEIPFVIFLWFYVKKFANFSFPYTDIGKYISVTLVFIGVFVVMSDTLIEYNISIYDFLPGVILQLLICIGLYLLVTFLIDKKTRLLFKSIIAELASKK